MEDVLRQIAAATAANMASQAQADARQAAMADAMQQQAAAQAAAAQAVQQQMQAQAAAAQQQLQQQQQQQQAAQQLQQQQMQSAFDQMATAHAQAQQQQAAMAAELLRIQTLMAAASTTTSGGAASASMGPGVSAGPAGADGIMQGLKLIDTKGLGTPARFNGVAPKFSTWSTKLTSWLPPAIYTARRSCRRQQPPAKILSRRRTS